MDALWAFGGALLVIGSWVAYLATVPSGRVPARPAGHIAVQLLGLGLGVLAIVQSHGTVLSVALGSITLSMGGLFLFLFSQRKTPLGKIRVAVGDRLLPFTAIDHAGATFDSTTLSGNRVLLKFFRGHW